MIHFLTSKFFTKKFSEISKACPDKGKRAGEVSGAQVSWGVAEVAGSV